MSKSGYRYLGSHLSLSEFLLRKMGWASMSWLIHFFPLLHGVLMKMHRLSVGCSAECAAVLPNKCFLLVKYYLLRRVRTLTTSLLSCASSEGT